MKSKLILLTQLIILFLCVKITAQVGINTTSPDQSSILDISSTNKGLLIPRINLISASDITTIINPRTSLLIYNTATTTGIDNVSPGFYYWDSTKWVSLNNNLNWLITGNNNITSSNFLGTTNSNAISIRTDNVEKSKDYSKRANRNVQHW